MDALEFFLQQLGNGIILGSAYALVAIGLTLVFGVLGVINLAQGEILVVGAFAGLVCLERGVGLALALLAGGAAAAVLGLLIERVALRPLPASADPHVRMVSTIGVAVVIQQVVSRLFSARQHPYPTPALLEGRFSIGPVQFDFVNLFILALAAVLMLALTYLVHRTKLGIAVRAVAESPRTAAMMGINSGMVVPLVFALSSALAGVAGVLVGMYFNNIGPFIGIPIGLKALAAVIFGGLGSVAGAVIASLVIGVAEVLTVAYFASSWRDAVAFAIIIAALMLRPSGLLGARLAQKV
jgi:branched-chain amino acid transport system permease protein